MNDTQYDKLKDAIANLRREYEVLKFSQYLKFTEQKGIEIPLEIQQHNFQKSFKNSVIKSFEICYDTMWKHLKKYLEDIGTPDIPNSPIKIFNLAHKSKIITEEMNNQLIKYNDIRGKTAHDYGQPKAEIALEEIESFIDDVTKLYQIMTKSK